VAANWVHLGPQFKIGAHLMFNILTGLVLYRSAQSNNYWWREGCAFLFFALILTMIALTGQVYQLGGNIAAALALWIVIGSPVLFLYGHSALNAVIWLGGALTAFHLGVMELVRNMGESGQFYVALTVSFTLPLMMIAAGCSNWLARTRGAWRMIIGRAGIVFLTIGASTASLLWYFDLATEVLYLIDSLESYLFMAAICLSAPVATACFARFRGYSDGLSRNGTIFIITSLLFMAAPSLLMSGGFDFIGPIHFIAFWLFAAWIAVRLQSDSLLSLAIWLVTLRIIIVYIELFGGLLMTGLGLIAGGAAMLATLKAASLLKKRLLWPIEGS
jgi:hypothetical protein